MSPITLAYEREIRRGERLFPEMFKLNAAISASMLATFAAVSGHNNMDHPLLGFFSARMNGHVEFLIDSTLHGTRPPPKLPKPMKPSNNIWIGFRPSKSPKGSQPKPGQHFAPGKVHGFKDEDAPISAAVGRAFVDYYERNMRAVETVLQTKVTTQWPMLLQFCWAVRNALAHKSGKIDFQNPKRAQVTWEDVTLDPEKDIGKRLDMPPFDVRAADLISLLYDFDAELDRLGCPFNLT